MIRETEKQETEDNQCDPFSVEKIFGVATLGAVVSLGMYFLYQNLGEEHKKTVKDSLAAGFRAALHL